MDQSIIPECFIDTNLIKTLLSPTGSPERMWYCAKVMKQRFADCFALSIIDRDKHEVDYLKEFNEICTSRSLILHKHTIRDQLYNSDQPCYGTAYNEKC